MELNTLADPFTAFEDHGPVEGIRSRLVQIALEDERIHEIATGARGIGSIVLRTNILIERCARQQVVIIGIRQVCAPDKDAIDRPVETAPEIALDAQAGLLRLRAPVVGRGLEDHRKGRERTSLADVDAELRQIGRRDGARRSGNTNHSAGPQRSKNIGGALRTRGLDGC